MLLADAHDGLDHGLLAVVGVVEWELGRVLLEFTANPHQKLVIPEHPNHLLPHLKGPVLQLQLLRHTHQILDNLQHLNQQILFPQQKLELARRLLGQDVQRTMVFFEQDDARGVGEGVDRPPQVLCSVGGWLFRDMVEAEVLMRDGVADDSFVV